MYTPITKRVKVAQHKSSVAKSTEDENKKTETAQTANAQGNLQNTTGTGNEGGTETKKRLSYREAYDQDIEGVRTGGKYANFDSYVADREKQRKNNPQAFEADMFAKTGVSGGPGQTTTTTTGNADFKSEPVMQDAEAASRIDLFSSPEGRASFRTGQSQGRFTRKTANQYAKAEDKLAKFLEKNKGAVPEAGDKGYRRYQKLLTARDTFKSQSEGAENRLKNYRQMTDGMRNRYLSQTMDYDRDLTKGKKAGPVKAPEGTQTEEEFKSRFKKDLGINGGSSNPQATTTPTSSFSEMAAASMKPIKLDTSALFTGNLFQKGQKKSPAFKMKGYGSNR
jgi:hypothetical protein